ncbi:MAG TPA: hypothetical protein VHB51_00825 [Candidatus Saccharimonadales bacterium]|nr:hypothetical protein [Candidatus Saccharimonadales bacterium]
MQRIKHKLISAFALALLFAATPTAVAFADTCGGGGGGHSGITTAINIGCKGIGNPITDLVFAIIRILSDGVGLVIVGSLVVAGIQYSAAGGDPNGTANAVKRIRSTVMAMLFYIFGYAFLNYILPAGFLHQ